KPIGIVTEEQLLPVLDAVTKVHERWGDRQNRHWARVKYLIKVKGTDWYRDQVSSIVGYPIHKPRPDLDYGNRQLHFGWWQQPNNGKWSYGMYVENGRIMDGTPNGDIKSCINKVMD
ncbi:MAG: nitrite reductase, partial [Phototrophicales bacterium]